MDELTYSIVTMLEAIRLEIRAASFEANGFEGDARTNREKADTHAREGINAGAGPIYRKES